MYMYRWMGGGGGGGHIGGVDTCSLLQGSIGNVLFSQQMKSDDVYHRGFPWGHVLLQVPYTQDVMALYSGSLSKVLIPPSPGDTINTPLKWAPWDEALPGPS